jgi:hypothetical protein
VKTINSQEDQAVSPADVWDTLSAEQQARVIHLLAQMIYKLVTAQANVSMEETSNAQMSDHVVELNERLKSYRQADLKSISKKRN